ncbi:MAG: sensor histidine kinase [Actinomycetia bacterium]|nr:sensor histidine kinase [Actinomycetes bacterium]
MSAMRDSIRSLLAQPRVPNPPVRVWRDWVLVGVLVSIAILEAVLRDDVVWQPLALALAIAMIIGLLWRRTHPLAVVALTFGVLNIVNIAAFVSDAGDVGLYVSVFVALLPYSLFRWGSGRDAAIGMGIMLVTAAIASAASILTDPTPNIVLEAVIGSSLFLILPAAIGALVRYETSARANEIYKAKLLEREQLARELHDTVAHHVSAIVIQAQAGHTIAASHPEAAADALQVIEEEASRTLAEMRQMVGALRDDDTVDLSPQRGVADIERLAMSAGDTPTIAVDLSGDFESLTPAVDAAIYRLAQESITNAVRHARNATRIDVGVVADAKTVHLTVNDNGDTSGSTGAPGYGIVGMKERAILLGGSFEAGPGPVDGWRVDAVVPRYGATT